MDREDLLDLIHLQILKAETQLGTQMARSEPTGTTVGLLRSLRLTLKALSSGLDPQDEAASAFVLSVSEKGQILLRRDRCQVGLSGPTLGSLLEHAGVSLVPGQVILVEPGFAKRAIEDSLGNAAEEEFRLERTRAELRGALQHCADASRGALLQALGDLEEREADLLIDRIGLSELNALVGRALPGRTGATFPD